MKLFVSQKASITSEDASEKLSKLLEVFATYTCAIERNLVSLVVVSEADMKALKIQRVSSTINLFIRHVFYANFALIGVFLSAK